MTFFIRILAPIFMLPFAVLHSADSRRRENLEIGHREITTAGGAEGIRIVYSVTADLSDSAVVFDLDAERSEVGKRISRSVVELRIKKDELTKFMEMLKKFDEWRDKSRAAKAAPFEKPIARIGNREWICEWFGKGAALKSSFSFDHDTVRLIEDDVTVFRVLLFSAPDMEREITAWYREKQKRSDDGKRFGETLR